MKGMLISLLQEYYLVTTALIVGVAAGLLGLANMGVVASWLLIIFCGAMAIKLAWGMLQTLREGKWGIDILAVTAILATLAVGEYWASLVIVLMLTGGEALEDYAGKRATREVSALLARAPQHAHRRTKNGKIEDITVSAIRIGDILIVKPGEVLPVDATLQKGSASFDESSLTGESLPVEHKAGDELLSGSVNGNTAIEIKAVRTAHESQYQQIIELVKAASNTEAPFVRLADRYAVPFTIISFAIAGLAWALSGDALRFAQVLVVATPCPLLLGAPIAFISGMSRAAKHGIIVKSGAILEKLASVATVAFDKTGTLTHGEPAVSSIKPVKIGATELLRLAASVEQQSTHTLATALVAAAKEQKINLLHATNTNEQTSHGVTATLKGKKVLVGKADFLRVNGVKLKEQAASVGETSVYVAHNGVFVGTITFADALRENSKTTLDELRAQGVTHTLMLTGDSQATADRIAKSLGITEVRAECLPADKVAAVKAEAGRPVMMVGDGVNDAPVLAAADVGMAMGARGSTAASESADVVVVLDDISRVSKAIAIAKTTMHIALQSVWIGIIISVGLMVVAATGVIPAVLGAGLQEIVDVVVIFNALRAHGAWRSKAI